MGASQGILQMKVRVLGQSHFQREVRRAAVMKVNAKKWNKLKKNTSRSKKYSSSWRSCLTMAMQWNGQNVQAESRLLDLSMQGGNPNIGQQTLRANVDPCGGSLFIRSREMFKMMWDLEMETV